MPSLTLPSVYADNEWSSLQSVIVGRAKGSCFPSEPKHMMEAAMPEEFLHRFHANSAFEPELLERAELELDGLVDVLKSRGVTVYRPEDVDWVRIGGYTGSMARDGLLTVGTHLIEAPYAWKCRKDEIELCFGKLLDQLSQDPAVRVIRKPEIGPKDTIYDGLLDQPDDGQHRWAVNNSRPAFDAADFSRLGKTIVGQMSHVTNEKGVEWLRQSVPEGYKVEIIDVHDTHAMHIDATFLPLRDGLAIYNPERVSEAALRRVDVLKDWKLIAYEYPIPSRSYPPRYMCSGWLLLNILSLDDSTLIVEENDHDFINLVESLGFETIKLPFQHVHSIGGSFHCATLDLVRSS